MYMNYHGVQLRGYGAEITNKPDSLEAFDRDDDDVMPEGMSLVPIDKGEEPVPVKQTELPLPPTPPDAAGSAGKVLYQGIAYERDELIKSGWTAAQVAALPLA
jgi:hypothetical protein